MAVTGDSYIVELKPAHLKWGVYRYTESREPRKGEAYLPIPRDIACSFGLYNGNKTGKKDVLGVNLFNCNSKDGLFEGLFKSQGSSRAGDVYAKQFSVKGNLKSLSKWYETVGAQEGDRVRVTWTSPTDIEIELL